MDGFVLDGLVLGVRLKSDEGRIRLWGYANGNLIKWKVLHGPIVGFHWQHDNT